MQGGSLFCKYVGAYAELMLRELLVSSDSYTEGDMEEILGRFAIMFAAEWPRIAADMLGDDAVARLTSFGFYSVLARLDVAVDYRGVERGFIQEALEPQEP